MNTLNYQNNNNNEIYELSELPSSCSSSISDELCLPKRFTQVIKSKKRNIPSIKRTMSSASLAPRYIRPPMYEHEKIREMFIDDHYRKKNLTWYKNNN